MQNKLAPLWIIQLRWVAIAAQTVLVLGVRLLTDVETPVATLLGLLGVLAASNGALHLLRSRMLHANQASATAVQTLITGALAFDIGILTLGLYLSGGPMNPFSFLYVVPVAIGAVVLRPAVTAGLCTLAVGGYGLLYATASNEHAHHHGSMQLHLEGMWLAMASSAVLVAYFVVSLQQKLHAQERELEAAREREARYDKLASLTTLAAGAAHELATPLATIAVTAKELELALAEAPELAGEATIIREETARCRAILLRLSAKSGDHQGEAAQRMDIVELLERALGRVSDPDRVKIDCQDAQRPSQTRGIYFAQVPVEPVVEAFTALVQNALDASTAEVCVSVGKNEGRFCVHVKDTGCGISDVDRDRVFDPFYSTKDNSSRMGLGLFVARKVAEQLGGSLVLDSTSQGTTASMCFHPAA